MEFGKIIKTAAAAGLISALSGCATNPRTAAWEPEKQVEFVVPFGTGGGADQMARLMQGIIVKYDLMKQPLMVVNKPGSAGAEGFFSVKNSAGDPHKIIITLSNLYVMPLATGTPFNWKDITPVAMLARDQFILWTNAEKPYKTGKEYIDAVKAAGPGKMKMGGTGSKQEDQILTVAIEKATGTKFSYVPYRSGGQVADQLVDNRVDSSVNNPVEAIAQWRAGSLRPLCVFDDARLPYKAKVTATQSWNDIPTCKEAGVPASYQMLRGIFMPPGVSPDQVAYFVEVFKRVVATPEWKDYMEKGVFDQTFMNGKEYTDWLTKDEALHKQLMTEAGFLSK